MPINANMHQTASAPSLTLESTWKQYDNWIFSLEINSGINAVQQRQNRDMGNILEISEQALYFTGNATYFVKNCGERIF